MEWSLDTAETTFQAAWPTTRGAGQVVAVVDTGVYGAHEDLQGAVLPGADFVGGTGAETAGIGQYDPNGHGTHVAGIIAAWPATDWVSPAWRPTCRSCPFVSWRPCTTPTAS